MGAVRLFLALVVVTDHWRQIILMPMGLGLWGGFELGVNAGYAVMFFYIASGFLISSALDHKYPPTTTGIVSFYKSRFIRIFSLYWPMVAVAFLIEPRGAIGHDPADIFTNLFLFGIDWRICFAGYPEMHWDAAVSGLHQAWTLGPELTFYAVAPFLLRSRGVVLIALAASAVTRLFLVSRYGFSEIWTYHFMPATFLFFLLGHLSWRISRRWNWLLRGRAGFYLLAAVPCALSARHFAAWDGPRFWIAALCFAASLPGVFQATKNSRVLNLLGELSYPVYLVQTVAILALEGSPHFQSVARALVVWRGAAIPYRGGAIAITLTLLGLSAVIVAAITAHYLAEKPTAIAMRLGMDAVRRFQRGLAAPLRSRKLVPHHSGVGTDRDHADAPIA